MFFLRGLNFVKPYQLSRPHATTHDGARIAVRTSAPPRASTRTPVPATVRNSRMPIYPCYDSGSGDALRADRSACALPHKISAIDSAPRGGNGWSSP
eukprot:6045415-Prymnesium_polylepis.1